MAHHQPPNQPTVPTLPPHLRTKIYNLTFTAVPATHFVGHTHLYRTSSYAEQRFISAADFRANNSTLASSPINVQVSRGVGKCCLFASPDSATLLHVDRASRQRFAASFFGGVGARFECDDLFEMAAFLASLDPGHAAMIRDIRSWDPCVYVEARVAASMVFLDGRWIEP